MRNPKPFSNHAQPGFVTSEQTFYYSHVIFCELVACHAPFQNYRVFVVVSYQLFLGDPFKVVDRIVGLVIVEVDDIMLVVMLFFQESLGYQTVYIMLLGDFVAKLHRYGFITIGVAAVDQSAFFFVDSIAFDSA